MSDAWECRPYREGDERGILDLYREVFRLDLTPEYWRWAFQHSPDGPAVIAVIEQNHRIVGHYEVTPKRFWIGGERCLAGYAGGTMLAPQVRNVTSFVEIAKLAYQMCRERGLSWLYCCPNEAALSVRTKLLQWRPLTDIVEWEGPLPQSAGQSRHVQTWQSWPKSLALPDFGFVDDVKSIRSERTAAWVKWRYFDRPGVQYVLHTVETGQQFAGFAMTKRYRRDGIDYGHIVDWQLHSASSPQASELLASVWRQLDDWGVGRVSCWADGNWHWQQALSQAGLSCSGRKSHLCYYELMGEPAPKLAVRDNWQIVMADCDVY